MRAMSSAFSQRATTMVATALPTRLVGVRPCDISRWMPRISATLATGIVPCADSVAASTTKAAADAGATVLMSNHSEFDNAATKIKMMAARKPGEPHPFEIGAEAVARYFKVTDECAQLARYRLGHTER